MIDITSDNIKDKEIMVPFNWQLPTKSNQGMGMNTTGKILSD